MHLIVAVVGLRVLFILPTRSSIPHAVKNGGGKKYSRNSNGRGGVRAGGAEQNQERPSHIKLAS